MSGSPHRSWPNADDYAYLAQADRRDFAWEWLRRDPEYRRLAPAANGRLPDGLTIIEAAPPAIWSRWGCLHVEEPDRRAIDTSILWARSLDRTVLKVAARPPSSDADLIFDLRHWSWQAVVVPAASCEHVLLRTKGYGFRLDVIDGSVLDGPVALRFEIGWADDPASAVDTLRQFLKFGRRPDLAAVPATSDRKTRRQIDALRTHDALVQGGSIRDIGLMLFGADRVQADWHAPGEALKSHCRRLIDLARDMASSGYRTLLY